MLVFPANTSLPFPLASPTSPQPTRISPIDLRPPLVFILILLRPTSLGRNPPLESLAVLSQTLGKPLSKRPKADETAIGTLHKSHICGVYRVSMDITSERRFEPLAEDEFRLLLLQPRSSGDIRCTLTTRRLPHSCLDAPSYEALSYEWGTETPVLSIVVDGESVSVRENLWWALHHLRLESGVRMLWIDALCIDQGNISERNRQVARMDQIYTSASTTIAWLGRENTDEFELGIDFIKKRQRHIQRYPWLTWFCCGSRRDLDSFESLCNRTYWTRLWIVQEILLSHHVTIQCGSHQLPWTALVKTFADMQIHRPWAYETPQLSSGPHRLYAAYLQRDEAHQVVKTPRQTPRLPLIELSTMFQNFICADSRDHVFALLGLAKSCCRTATAVDYALSKTEVFASMLLHHMSAHTDLSITHYDLGSNIRMLWGTISSNSAANEPVWKHNGTLPLLNFPHQPETFGTVIWIVSLETLRMSLQTKTFDRPLDSFNHAARPLSISGNAVSSELGDNPLDCPTNPTTPESIIHKFLSTIFVSQGWRPKRSSLNVLEAELKRQIEPEFEPTRLFLTDMGYFGISESSLATGMTLRSGHRHIVDQMTGYTTLWLDSKRCWVLLDPYMKFQELLSLMV